MIRFNRIGLKLIITVSLAVIIIISVFAYFSIQFQSETLTAEVERHANQLSETIKHSTRFDMLANRRDHIHNIINTIGNEEYIRNVRVMNKIGEISYSTDQNEIGKMVDKNAEACYACHAKNEPIHKLSIKERTRIFQTHQDSSRILGIINPIYNEKSCYEAECHAHGEDQTVLGVLDISISLTEVDHALTESKISMLFFALLSILIIALIIWYFVKKFIQKPVRKLVEATNYVAVGNLNHKIQSTRKDELGKLATSFNNMTEKLSEARLQLFQSDKMASLGRLAAGVAHEINNPLTGVLTYSSFLLKRASDNPEMKNDLEVIVRETKRSREIVKGLLDFSRQSTPKSGKVDINEVINNAEAILTNQIKINKINFEKQLMAKLPEVYGDANQLQQVIINLVVNSIDAIENDGTIKVSTTTTTLQAYGVATISQATCPKGHNLMDEHHKIDGRPSIKLKAKSKINEGFVHLDPVYGNHNHHYGIQFEDDEYIQLFCPQCGISLTNESDKTPHCKAPTYTIFIPNQGELKGCTRFGCNWQKWDFVDRSGEKSYVQIIVEDNGAGINQENLDKIFDPFFSTKGQKGTGLGLSVIWGIIDNHKGKIKVSSKINEGTKFTIHIPEAN